MSLFQHCIDYYRTCSGHILLWYKQTLRLPETHYSPHIRTEEWQIASVSSQRSSNVSSPPMHKPSWFKSLERLSRKSKPSKTPALSSEPPASPPKTITPLKHLSAQRNLRFFGDTDLESLSKVSTIARQRKPIHSNHSRSAHSLTQSGDQARPPLDKPSKMKSSTSMQQINKNFRSKYLADLSESTSENENGHNRSVSEMSPSKYKPKRPYHSTEMLENDSRDNSPSRQYRGSSMDRLALRERNRSVERPPNQLSTSTPIKPAREFERRQAFSKYSNSMQTDAIDSNWLSKTIFRFSISISTPKVQAPKETLVNRVLFIYMQRRWATYLSRMFRAQGVRQNRRMNWALCVPNHRQSRWLVPYRGRCQCWHHGHRDTSKMATKSIIHKPHRIIIIR